MDDPTKWALAIGSFCVLFGFIALLTSRIYTNKANRGGVEVDVPFFGKMKGNYPALVFVLFGAAITAYAIKTNADLRGQQIVADKERVAAEERIAVIRAGAPGDEQWVITGRLVSPDGKRVDWERGVLTLFAGSPDVAFNPGGGFVIKLTTKKGEDLERYVQKIDYSNFESGSATIFPQVELDKFKRSEPTLLERKTELTRQYRAVQLQPWSQP